MDPQPLKASVDGDKKNREDPEITKNREPRKIAEPVMNANPKRVCCIFR